MHGCVVYIGTPELCAALHSQARTYNYIRVHARRHLPSAVPRISEDRLSQTQRTGEEAELSDGHEGGVDADEEGEKVGEGW